MPPRVCTGPEAERETVWGYTVHMDTGGDTAQVVLVVGGMHGHELAGSDFLHEELIPAAAPRWSLSACLEPGETWRARAVGGARSGGGLTVLAVPTFSVLAACRGDREERGRDNNRQFPVGDSPPARPPMAAQHLANLVEEMQAGLGSAGFAVLDYHNGFGRFGDNIGGMGHAAYGSRTPESVRLCRAVAAAVPGMAVGSDPGSRFHHGPAGSLREFCASRDVAYVLVEVMTPEAGRTREQQRQDARLTFWALVGARIEAGIERNTVKT
jgi:predicted deacylase